MSSRWTGATVLITGGTGWFGKHFVEQCLEGDLGDVRKVRVYSRDEHKQHTMRQRWPDTGPDARVTYVVGDVRDGSRLSRACRGVDIVIHAAALKRIEGSATHAREFVKTNVIGTANVIDAAIDNEVPYTVFVSSDKAALATNCYGKTKAIAEDLMIEGNALAGGKQHFSCVRYGNVLGSTGSVLSLWDAAIKAGEPVPITSAQMTRFWLPVQDAVTCVLETVESMQGGEIVCPKMQHGYVMTLLNAYLPDDVQVQEIGERPGGEKLAETMIGEDELRHTTQTHGAYVIHPQLPVWNSSYRSQGEPIGNLMAVRSDDLPLASVEQVRALLDRAGLLP